MPGYKQDIVTRTYINPADQKTVFEKFEDIIVAGLQKNLLILIAELKRFHHWIQNKSAIPYCKK